jgi:YidC/Oxa1 family membrane protein insertase
MDNRRLILLLVFSFALIMLWEAWQKQNAPHPAAPSASAASTPAVTAAAAPTPLANALPGATPLAAAPGAGGVDSPAKVATAVVRTDLFEAEISSLGGDLQRLELIKHRATGEKSKNFVLFENGQQHVYEGQSGFIGSELPNHKTLYQLIPGNHEMKLGQDTVELRLEAVSPAGLRTSKIYTFKRGSYQIEIAHEVVNSGSSPVSPFAYFQIVRDGKPPEGTTSAMGMGVSTFTGPAVYTEQDKFQKIDFSDIEKGKEKHALKADNGWVAMVQHYFVSAWLPQGNVAREFFTRKLGNDLYAAGVIVPMGAVAPGATGRLTVPLYAGPQEQDNLTKIAPGLNLVVDYGWLTVIAAPLFWVLEMFHGLVGNWGWAIIILTVLLKLVFFPLSAASYKSMAKMRVLTPKLAKLKETYGEDKQKYNQEMMELYKREKINPLGGCLPILVQIPVFISLYWVLLGTVEMRDAPWLGWISDLSTKDPYYVLPLIMGATMLIQTKLNPAPPDPIQAKIMLLMPIVFTGMFLFFPAGLVLYWTVNNLLSIAQQWQITRLIEGGKK